MSPKDERIRRHPVLTPPRAVNLQTCILPQFWMFRRFEGLRISILDKVARERARGDSGVLQCRSNGCLVTRFGDSAGGGLRRAARADWFCEAPEEVNVSFLGKFRECHSLLSLVGGRLRELAIPTVVEWVESATFPRKSPPRELGRFSSFGP